MKVGAGRPKIGTSGDRDIGSSDYGIAARRLPVPESSYDPMNRWADLPITRFTPFPRYFTPLFWGFLPRFIWNCRIAVGREPSYNPLSLAGSF
jgi:hypothetical protein